ncbi:MAG TPA: hypothetical protein VGB73_01085 [Pyrinomonadaceae bacterium]
MSRLILPAAERNEQRAPLRERGFEAHAPSAVEKREDEARASLRLLIHTDEGEPQQPLTLPVLATAGDVREVVQYLKKKPSGVSIVEAMDDVKKRVFEPRKVAAYEFWGIVTRSGERLQLSPLGWEFARKLEPEAEAYRALLDNTAPYRSALEWMHQQSLDLFTHADIAAYWQALYAASLEQNEKTMEGNVVCFFHLCQAAEFGTVTIGKRGQPARLRVEREELASHLAGRSAPTSRELREMHAAETERRFPVIASNTSAPARTMPTAAASLTTPMREADRLRVFVSGSRRAKLIEQLQTVLELADIESRIVEEREPGASVVSEEIFRAMRDCEAGLIIVTGEECCKDEAGQYALKEKLLTELTTAFVLYDRRVALLWDARLPVPSNLRDLPLFKFEGDDLNWDVGVKLLKAIKEFQHRARQESRSAGSFEPRG